MSFAAFNEFFMSCQTLMKRSRAFWRQRRL